MKFYRVADASDFEKAESEFSELPFQAKDYIVSDLSTSRAVNYLFSNWSYSKQQARVACNAYLAYLKAKSDFRKGETVYTEY